MCFLVGFLGRVGWFFWYVWVCLISWWFVVVLWLVEVWWCSLGLCFLVLVCDIWWCWGCCGFWGGVSSVGLVWVCGCWCWVVGLMIVVGLSLCVRLWMNCWGCWMSCVCWVIEFFVVVLGFVMYFGIVWCDVFKIVGRYYVWFGLFGVWVEVCIVYWVYWCGDIL